MTHVVVAFSHPQSADLLTAYLNANGIEANVVIVEEESSSHHCRNTSFQVSVTHIYDHERAKLIAEDFMIDPSQPKFQASAWEQNEGITSGSQAFFNGNSANIFKQAFLTSPFTLLITMLCVLVFVLSAVGFFSVTAHYLEIRPLSELVDSHQWWRIIGPNFLHFSFMHIAFNLIWWWLLAKELERSFGTSALILFFVIASVFSNVSQLIISGPNFGGLSGVVYALVGFVWWIGWLRPSWLISLPKNIIYFLLAWLVIGYLDLLWIKMANEAHTFGLLSGCLMALLIHIGTPKGRASG